MNAGFVRGDHPSDEHGHTVVDVSGVETDRVAEYVSEWFPDVSDLYLERKGGRTFLVAGK